MYSVRSWNPRKSVAVTRLFPLLPGYLLISSSVVPRTRHACQFLVGSRGEPLRVPEAERFLARVAAGHFNEDLTLGAGLPELDPGTSVLVEMLGLVGVVTARRKNKYSVELSSGRKIETNRGMLSLV